MSAEHDPVTNGLFRGERGLALLWARVAECRNTPSADYYLDLVLRHPLYVPEETR